MATGTTCPKWLKIKWQHARLLEQEGKPLLLLSLSLTGSLSLFQISIPNDTHVSSLAWHSGEGWLAVGGNTGLLRVLKLELQQQGDQLYLFIYLFNYLLLLF